MKPSGVNAKVIDAAGPPDCVRCGHGVLVHHASGGCDHPDPACPCSGFEFFAGRREESKRVLANWLDWLAQEKMRAASPPYTPEPEVDADEVELVAVPVVLTKQMVAAVDQLVATGLHGGSRAAVVDDLVRSGLVRLHQEGWWRS